ncbi:hypothetical protein GEMRC1_012083 [Eukaryota sp. GEM-RC1]
MELFFDILNDPEDQFAEELHDSTLSQFQSHGVPITVCQNSISGSIGSSLWPATDLFLQFLETFDSQYFLNKSIIELGSGVGLLSMVCAVMGASKVLATDIPFIINWIDHNFSLNTHLPYFDSLLTQSLLWGDKDDIQHVFKTFLTLDFVIASDVVYSTESVPLLLDTIKQFIDRYGCTVWIALKWRSADTTTSFRENLKYYELSTRTLSETKDKSIILLEILKES